MSEESSSVHKFARLFVGVCMRMHVYLCVSVCVTFSLFVNRKINEKFTKWIQNKKKTKRKKEEQEDE